MSFKREGNDKHLLNVLRQRRVKDLLADEIPQDEAKLLSNGRLACMVCSSHPIFDTVNMLAIHRQGKKHLANVIYKEQEKQEIKNLIIKRKQEQFLKDGTTNIQQATTLHKGLSCSIPYDSRVKKHKIKPYDRKPTLNLTGEAPTTGLVSSLGSGNIPAVSHQFDVIQQKRNSKRGELSLCETDSVNHNSLPSNHTSQTTINQNNLHGDKDPSSKKSSNEKKNVSKKKAASHNKNSKYLEMITMQNEGPVRHSSQLHRIFQTQGPADNAFTVNQPYISKKHKQLVFNADRQAETNSFRREHSPIKISLKKSNFKKELPIQNGNLNRSKAKLTSPQSNPLQTSFIRLSSACNKEVKTDQGTHWQLGGSGWKRDWDGKWIKDEEAEFDSDEEPPKFV